MQQLLVIRCGTPGCDWGYRVQDLGEEQLDLCYSEFRKHCIQLHGFEEWNTDAHMRLDLAFNVDAHQVEPVNTLRFEFVLDHKGAES